MTTITTVLSWNSKKGRVILGHSINKNAAYGMDKNVLQQYIDLIGNSDSYFLTCFYTDK